MTLTRRRFIAISAAASAMPRAALANPATRWSGIALGASASLTIAGLPRADAEPLIAAARAEIERLEAIFSLYREDGALMRLNRAGRLDGPPLDMIRLLSTVDMIHEVTGGAFDPTVQPLWRTIADARGRPNPQDERAARALIGWQHVRVTADSVFYARPGMAMTLNGIAQGYVTDRVADLLRATGLSNVLVSIGEIAALGEREAGRPWRVGLAERGDDVAEEALDVRDMAVATTAPNGTMIDAKGAIGHILDPRGGMVPRPWRRLTVVHASAAIADGLSTGLVLCDSADIARCVRTFADCQVVAVARDGRRLEHASG